MKDIPYKFRGASVLNGEYVYGGIYQTDGKTYIIRNIDGEFTMVDPASVEQLCGYDSADNEIYEWNQLTCDGVPFLTEFTVGFAPYCFNDNGALCSLDTAKCSLAYVKKQGNLFNTGRNCNE